MTNSDRQLNVLVLEDNDLDYELILGALAGSGFGLNAQRAKNRAQFEVALRGDVDMIIADYSLPSFTANEAIAFARDQEVLAPIIVVTGSLDDEAAVRSIKAGASDYLLKDRLARLGSAVERALAEQRLYLQQQETLRRERLQADRLKAIRLVDMAISASLDLNITLNVLLDQVMSLLKVDAAAVLLLDETGRVLEYAQGRGFITPKAPHWQIRLGDGLVGRVAAERRPISVPDLSTVENIVPRPELLEEGFVSYNAVPLIAKGQTVGVLEMLNRMTFVPEADWLEFLEALAASAAIAVDNARLFDRTQRANAQLVLAYDRTLEGWAKTLELRDFETEGHSRRVTELAEAVGRQLNLDSGDLVDLRHGALLHDIGKIAVPDHVLRKPGALDEDERAQMQQHPTYALELLKAIPFLKDAMTVAYSHHEKWDGSGYPLGLQGDRIPELARIFAICDVYDALRSERPYKRPWTVEQSREYVGQMAGTHFDPEVTRAFLSLSLT